MQINIEKNIYDIDLDSLITMASRANNKKRNFLFVSKVLGKHIEVKPNMCKAIGFLLASLVCEENKSTNNMVEAFKNNSDEISKYFNDFYKLEEKITVLGFAETATGIGMSVAGAIKDSNYLTTTREDIEGLTSILKFEEEHSHATTHKCYLLDKKYLMDSKRIILVDDEITTGKSMLNIIKELKRVTSIKKYTVLSILDWRNNEYRDAYEVFAKENHVDIEVRSLISGNIKNTDNTVFYDSEENTLSESTVVKDIGKKHLEHIDYKCLGKDERYIRHTGRFGTSFSDIEKMECVYKDIADEIGLCNKKKVLVLGHGENIYIPSRVASYLGENVLFKTTTRSPILCKVEESYPIKEKHVFYDRGVKYYFYNKSIIEKNFDRVILLTETDLDIKLTDNIEIFKL